MPLLGGARPVLRPGIVAGERRRQAAPSICDIVSCFGPLLMVDDDERAPAVTKACSWHRSGYRSSRFMLMATDIVPRWSLLVVMGFSGFRVVRRRRRAGAGAGAGC